MDNKTFISFLHICTFSHLHVVGDGFPLSQAAEHLFWAHSYSNRITQFKFSILIVIFLPHLTWYSWAADLGWTIKGPYSAGILNLMVRSTLTFLPSNHPPSPTNLLFASTQHPLKTRLATVWHMIPALCNLIKIIRDKIYHLPSSAQTMGPFSLADLGAWLSGEGRDKIGTTWDDILPNCPPLTTPSQNFFCFITIAFVIKWDPEAELHQTVYHNLSLVLSKSSPLQRIVIITIGKGGFQKIRWGRGVGGHVFPQQKMGGGQTP